MKKRIIIGLCVAVLLSGAAWWAIKTEHVRVPVSMLLQPPEMAVAQYSNKDVVGDLGGVPVTIPKHFAEYVEYDGDPGFGEKREGPIPIRTHKSKLSSFGFYVRYPDMVGISTDEFKEEKRKANIYKSMWISVGLHAGNQYKGTGTLDRLAHYTVEIPNNINKDMNYEKLAEKFYELDIYAPIGYDSASEKPYRQGEYAKDVFIYRNSEGKITTFIKCSNRPEESAPCEHWMDLEPLMKADVYISYRRGLLPEWKKIQSSVSQLIYSFKVKN